MPRYRKPLKKALVDGSVAKNPGRFKDRKGPKNTRPVGGPYESMNAAEKAVWRECVREMPWLHSAHRQLLRLVCKLGAKLSTDSELSVAETQALSSLLSKLGASPVDQNKVIHRDDAEDPDEKFFSRGLH